MKPGTLVKLCRNQGVRYEGLDHLRKDAFIWFNVLPGHVGMYIKTYKRNELIVNDIILIEDRLIEVDRGVMVPVE
jgi:hypothetical protein